MLPSKMKLSHTYRTINRVYALLVRQTLTVAIHVTACVQSYSTEVKKDIDFGKAVITLKCEGIHISSIFFIGGIPIKFLMKPFCMLVSLTGPVYSLTGFPASWQKFTEC